MIVMFHASPGMRLILSSKKRRMELTMRAAEVRTTTSPLAIWFLSIRAIIPDRRGRRISTATNDSPTIRHPYN
jgi:hypothetical protein